MEDKVNNHSIKSNRFIRFLDTTVLPQYQVIIAGITLSLVLMLSNIELRIQTPIESYPIIHPLEESFFKQQLSEPAVIKTGLQVNNFPVFKIAEDDFVLEGKIWFLFDPELTSLELVEKFSFENGQLIFKSEPITRMIDNLLFAEFAIRLQFNTPLVYKKFPFENHRIFLNLVNIYISPEEAIFKSEDNFFIFEENIDIPEWHYASHEVYTGFSEYKFDSHDQNKTSRDPKVLYVINFNRDGLRHIFVILIPLFLIGTVGLIAIGSQSTIGGKSLDINVACTASIIAYRFVIESMTPKSSGLMASDHIFSYFLIFSCIQLVYSKITYQQPRYQFWIIVRGLMTYLFYLGFIGIWSYLLFMWNPISEQTYTKPQISHTLDSKKEFYPDLSLPISPDRPTISLGTTVDLSRIERTFGRQIKNGINARLHKAIQENDPVASQLNIIFQDDESSTIKTRKTILELVKKTPLLFSSLGNITVESYVDLLKNKSAYLIFPISGSNLTHNPEMTQVINFRESFEREGEILAAFAFKEFAAKKILVLYEDTPLGIDGLKGIKKYAQENGIDLSTISEVSYQKHDIKFDRQIKIINRIDPGTIIFFMPGRGVLSFVRQIGIENLTGKNLLGTARLNEAFFKKQFQQKGINIITTNFVPDPEKSDIEIAKEFRDAAKAYNIHIGTFAFEAYINTDLLLYLLKKIDGKVTGEKIVQEAEKIKNLNYKGLHLNFDPQKRNLATTIWIDAGGEDLIPVLDTESLHEKRFIGIPKDKAF